MKEKLTQTYLLFQAPEGCPAAHPSSYGSPDQTTSYQQDCQMCPTHCEDARCWPWRSGSIKFLFLPSIVKWATTWVIVKQGDREESRMMQFSSCDKKKGFSGFGYSSTNKYLCASDVSSPHFWSFQGKCCLLLYTCISSVQPKRHFWVWKCYCSTGVHHGEGKDRK